MASGANPGETVYTIEAVASLPSVTAIRLEALPDPSLPKGGPGRDRVRQLPDERHRDRGRLGAGPLATHSRFAPTIPPAARASTASSRRRCLATRRCREDGESTQAARKRGCHGRSCSRSISRVAAGRAAAADSLKHQGAAVGQALGRFRLSVTSAASSQRIVGDPARLRPILAIAAAERTGISSAGSGRVLSNGGVVAEAGARSTSRICRRSSRPSAFRRRW